MLFEYIKIIIYVLLTLYPMNKITKFFRRLFYYENDEYERLKKFLKR
jgi:hypothetical protein